MVPTITENIRTTIQQPLSRQQGKGVVGPLLFSLIKIAVSTIQMIAGLITVIVTSPSLCCSGVESEKYNPDDFVCSYGIKNVIMGVHGIASALVNILSLGIINQWDI